MAGSAQSSNGDEIESFSCRIATSRPARVAPSAIRCSCSSRCPVDVNICGRVSMSRTGRPTWRAAMAVRVTCGQTIALEPKPPPTNRVITRTRDTGRPSSWATVSWVARMPCVDSYNVRSPSSQTATVDGASSAL